MGTQKFRERYTPHKPAISGSVDIDFLYSQEHLSKTLPHVHADAPDEAQDEKFMNRKEMRTEYRRRDKKPTKPSSRKKSIKQATHLDFEKVGKRPQLGRKETYGGFVL